MTFTSSALLQFDELIALVAEYAGSVEGRARVSALEPGSDREHIERDLAEAGEAIHYRREAGSTTTLIHFDRLRHVGQSLEVLGVAGTRLDGTEILDLFRTFEFSAEVRSLLAAVADSYPRLAAHGRVLADLMPVVRRWNHAFAPDGSLEDEASPDLRRIRREMERQKRTIQESLQRFMRAHRDDGSLQDALITVRDDRYVVPVVAGQKGRVDGVVHGASGSGRTLFVEPLETIGLNNELVELRDAETREIERILLAITDELRGQVEEIRQTAESLAHLDVVFAKAGFAHAWDAVIPVLGRDAGPRRLVLKKARHPLVQRVLRKAGRRIVPLSFSLDEQRRCLLISGPNTGGKTVTLKTAGLLALMAHAGLPVTCEEAEFPLLDDVLADIGDQQSIEESLSSFSGHLLHVKAMLESVTPNGLVLLDELGRATDPEEGGALGVAILDEFRKSGAFCLASTHLMPLKLYGSRTESVLNASMGFDDHTLLPTYELRIGLPGKSAGLAIATRLEMPPQLLELARTVLPSLQADFEELLANLHRELEASERNARELAGATAEMKRRTAELEAQWTRRESQRQREWARKTEELIADFETRAMLTVERVQEATEDRKAAEQARRMLSQTRREFHNEAETVLQPPPDAPRVESRPEPPVIAPGARVRLRDVREPATVRRILKNGILEVEAGLLRMQVQPEDVREVLPSTTGASRALPSNVRVTTGPRWDVSYRELNLIGQRADEATEALDKFLDSAALASVDRVRIVHGHGMGVLRRAVADTLSSNPHVQRFYAATPAEGGTGATIAELRA